MTLFQLAVILFLIVNPIGNVPTFLALLKGRSLADQQRILLREAFFSMCLALVFLFFGERFLCCFYVKDYALTVSGGIILFIVALGMIFPERGKADAEQREEPFLVPIATPLLSGAGLLTMIILYSHQEDDLLKMSAAILLAWMAVGVVLVCSPYLQMLCGERGLAALEQLMGMLLMMMAVERLVHGVRLFLASPMHSGL